MPGGSGGNATPTSDVGLNSTYGIPFHFPANDYKKKFLMKLTDSHRHSTENRIDLRLGFVCHRLQNFERFRVGVAARQDRAQIFL
jgi:hypothetical protein